MAYSYFSGCKIPYHLPEYGESARALIQALGIDLLEVEFNCCGYPVRDIDFQSFLLSGARNLALAEQENTDILTPCKCCFGSLKFVEHYLQNSVEIKDRINGLLKAEGLYWTGKRKIKHILTVLHQDVGIDKLRKKVVKSLRQVKVAVHTGCHALRPSGVTGFDNPMTPVVFNDLVVSTGAQCVPWSMSDECCGNPQWDKNQKLAQKQMERKLFNARQAGAEFICTACTYCQIQFEQKNLSFVQKNPSGDTPRIDNQLIPPVLITQLIGLSLGIENKKIGLSNTCQKKLLDIAGHN